MWNVFELILPSIANIKATKTIKKKILQKSNLSFPSCETAIESLTVNDLKILYDDDMRWKERLEDKLYMVVIP